jgi:hypothetical protein
MILEFKLYELKDTSKFYETCFEGGNRPNEFIIVGEESGFYKTQQVEEDGLCLIGGLPIDEFVMLVPKEDLKLKGDGIGVEMKEFDIPKDYLTLEIVETIQRLND